MTSRQLFVLTLRDAGDPHNAGLPAPRRLARGLKFLLRTCGLRCLTVAEHHPDAGDPHGNGLPAPRHDHAADHPENRP